MITLLIARHGNTFDPGDTILRVGKKTDLPLSNSGREQAKKLGVFLQENHPNIDHVFVSSLKRTQETAQIALPDHAFEINPIFDEIDYGVDDGQPETDVVARIGESALKRWEEEGVPPPDWQVDPKKIIQDWQYFADDLVNDTDAVILVVTSNGVARFAPSIVEVGDTRLGLPHSLKMRTGAVSAMTYIEGVWRVMYWDVRPCEQSSS